MFQKTIIFICVFAAYIGIVRSQFTVRCRDNTVGYYPKCNCEGENYGFSGFKCEPLCPSISDGVYPECKCRYGRPYDNATNSCPDPQCPLNTSTDSVYPKCNCSGRNYEYNAHLNECYLVCPKHSSGYFPECRCDDRFAGFNKGNKFLSVFFSVHIV